MLKNVEEVLKKMESFCRTKKNMFLPNREGIEEALQKQGKLRTCMEESDCYLDHFEYHLRDRMVMRMREVKTTQKTDVIDESRQTAPQPAPRSTPDTLKRQSEPTLSPETTTTKNL